MTECIRVDIMLTDEKAVMPTYAKDGDAGADVYAVPSNESKIVAPDGYRALDEKMKEVIHEDGDYLMLPGETIMIDLGLKLGLPVGWEMQVRSRSGMAKRGLVVANSPGTIDSGYRGPCMVLLHNQSDEARIIKPGTRVAQFVLKRAPQAAFNLVDVLDDTDRGAGGFGSTGTK